jgi:DNA-nicking Smr family endonuclease
MPKKTVITDEDINLFERAVQGTKPLAQGKVCIGPPKLKYAKKQPTFEDKPSFFDGGEPRDLIQDDDYIIYKLDGVPNKTLRKLSKGQYNVEAVLDLHRKTIEEARHAITQFLHECLNRGIRTVIIVHGKGKPGSAPVLKNKVNHWLRQVESVLAFCSAMPRHGGNGAVYVLLKNSN